MVIKSLHITAFGGLKNRDINLSPGVNVIGGGNESGKTSAAMFIKFVFYGLSSKSKGSLPSERQRYVNRGTMQASGYILAETNSGVPYRLERTLILSDSTGARERVRIINLSTGETVASRDPGEYFFGVNEDIFVSTCFVSQSAAIKPEYSKLDLGANDDNAPGDFTAADVKRGLKKLDTLRRELCHKNGGGGEISELKEKRAALAAESDSVSGRAAEIISTGISLDDITRRVSELEEARDSYAELFSALDKIVVKKRIDALAQTKAKLESVRQQISSFDSSPLGSEAEEALNSAERDIRAYDELVIAFDEEYSDSDGSEDDTSFIRDADDDIDLAHSYDSSAHTRLALSIAMLAAGIIGIAAFAVLYFFNTELYSIPLVFTLIMLTLGVVFISGYVKSKRRLRAVLDKWGAESIDSFENAVSERLEYLAGKKREAEEREEKIAALDSSKLRFDAAEAYVTKTAESSGIPRGDSVYETISAIREIISAARQRRDELVLTEQKLSGRLDALTELTDGVDFDGAESEAKRVMSTEAGKRALSLSQDEIKNALRERDFTENALKSALKRKSTLEEKLVSLGRLSHTPDEYRSMINSLDERIEELSLRHDACELAIRVISEAGESMRTGISARLACSASETLKSCTPHREITLDSELNPTLDSGGARLTHDILSRGTADLAYLSVRNALKDEMFREEKPITVFDESFAHIDIDRTKSFLSSLSGGQYLILTCREDELKAAESLGMNTVQI